MLLAGGRPGVPAAHAAGERRQGLGGQKQKWQEFPPVRALGCREFHVSNMFRGVVQVEGGGLFGPKSGDVIMGVSR